MPILRT